MQKSHFSLPLTKLVSDSSPDLDLKLDLSPCFWGLGLVIKGLVYKCAAEKGRTRKRCSSSRTRLLGGMAKWR